MKMRHSFFLPRTWLSGRLARSLQASTAETDWTAMIAMRTGLGGLRFTPPVYRTTSGSAIGAMQSRAAVSYSAFVERGSGWHVGQPGGLVVDVGGDSTQTRLVVTPVMGAEEQVEAGL